MIARPKISRNEWKTTEIGASKVRNFAPFSCSAVDGRAAELEHAVRRERSRDARGVREHDVRPLDEQTQVPRGAPEAAARVRVDDGPPERRQEMRGVEPVGAVDFAEDDDARFRAAARSSS